MHVHVLSLVAEQTMRILYDSSIDFQNLAAYGK